MNKRHYEHTLPNIRGSLSNTYHDIIFCKNTTLLLYSQIIARLPLFFSECSSISGKVRVTPPVAVSRFSQGKGRQYRRTWIWAKQPAYAMQREQESLHHSRSGKRSHAGVRHEKGAPGQFFSLSHMHYVGRSFRLLNPPHVRPCAFGAFFR